MITSKSNEQIKYISSLKTKKYRDIYSKYILEGIKLVDEVSSGNNIPELIVYSEELLNNAAGGKELLNKLKNINTQILEVSKEVFVHLSDTVTPQGVLAIMDIKKNNIDNLQEHILNNESFIILDKIQDAGNLGTIIRSSVSFDVINIIATVGTTDIYSPKTIRSTMGAMNKVNIWYLNQEEIEEAILSLKENNYEIIGTDLNAKDYLKDTKINFKSVFVMGNEANGVSEEIKKQCNKNIKIEMQETQESLNVGVATSILLYERYINL